MSNSDLSTRRLELQQKEKLLLSDMSEKSAKVKQIAIWSLVAGLVGLLGYGIYRSLSPAPKNKKRKKHKGVKAAHLPEEENKMVDKAIEYGAPIVGQWILNQLGSKEKPKN